MPRTLPKVTANRLQAICAALEEHVSEWHHVAHLGQQKGFEAAPTDDQVATILAGIGALTDILRAGMVARQMVAQQAEFERLMAERGWELAGTK